MFQESKAPDYYRKDTYKWSSSSWITLRDAPDFLDKFLTEQCVIFSCDLPKKQWEVLLQKCNVLTKYATCK